MNSSKILVSGCLLLSMAATAKEKRPNIIYIYADDLGKGMLSAYGQVQFTTPNIDRLIRRGTSFQNAYGCMLSAPARASLLTGYHDCHTDKWKISGGAQFMVPLSDTAIIAAKEAQIDRTDITLPHGDDYLPQVFKKAGYVTAEIGKLEWGFSATRKQMSDHGWDYYYGYLDHTRCHGFYPPFLFESGQIISIEGNNLTNAGKSIEKETEATYKERWNREGKVVYSQDLFLGKIVEFIRNNRDRPFFLFHPTQLPHGPVSVPAIHPQVKENANLTPIEKEYASMVKYLDDHVGIIMQELDRLGIANNTILVFSADNGHEIYYAQQGRCEKPYRNLVTGERFDDYANKYYSTLSGDVFNGNADMAGLKRSNLEGGIHIPLAFYCEGLIPSNSVSKALVSNYDFLPTMADLLKIPLKGQKDGESFLRNLMSAEQQSKERYLIFGSNNGPAIITNEGWKLRYYIKKETYELFYLPDDPQERHNLRDKQPDRSDRLKQILLRECGGDLSNGINRAG